MNKCTEIQPLMVSIRCLVYNHEPYLRQCLDGFVMQKTKFRFEAIVHDDASTDNSAAIIREYAEKYPDIIKPILETENQYSKHDGSLKRIMDSHTRGKYIALCEGDDYWTDPNKLQKQVDFMEGHPDYTMCFHDVDIKVEKGREYWDVFGKLENRDYTISECIKYWKVPTCSMVIRKNVFDKRPENKKFRVGDNVVVYTCLSYGKIRCIAKKMGAYRLTPTSWIGAQSDKKQRYMFISHYEGLLESLPICRCTEMYEIMETQYFLLMSFLKRDGECKEFDRIKEKYQSYPGKVHMNAFYSFYHRWRFNQIVKCLLGKKITAWIQNNFICYTKWSS